MTRIILIGAGKGGKARELGLTVSTDYRELLTGEEDLIIDVTGNPDVVRNIYELKPEGVEIIGGNAARFMWEFIEARKKAAASAGQVRGHFQSSRNRFYSSKHPITD